MVRGARRLAGWRPGPVLNLGLAACQAAPPATIASRAVPEAGPPADGQPSIPPSQIVAARWVFTLEDGSRVGVPMLCPRDPSGDDRACDPRTQVVADDAG